MSEYFGNYKRPKNEINYIEKFIELFNNSKEEYKSKKYDIALSGFIHEYELIKDIFDIIPKIVTLNYIIKCLFNLHEYNSIYQYISLTKKYFPNLIKFHKEKLIKYKSKIFIYEFTLNFILDNVDKSLLNITQMITYLKDSEVLSFEEKTKFFWIFLKKFIKLGEDIKSRKFIFFEEQYNNMIIEENISTKKCEKSDITKKKKISRDFIKYYKSFMNSDMRRNIYEKLNEKFYLIKYGNIDNRIINFLNENMESYINGGIKEIEKFKNYLLVSKIDLSIYNTDMDKLIFDQKRRINGFNTAFNSIVGAFKIIFKQNITKKDLELKSLQNSNSMKLILTKKDIKHIEESLIKKMKIKEITSNNIIRKNMDKIKSNSTLPFFDNEIKIPSVNAKINKNEKKLFFNNNKFIKMFNFSYLDSIENPNILLGDSHENKLPLLKKDKKENNNLYNKIRKKLALKINDKIQKKAMFNNKIIYRNINYFLISKFSDIYKNIINDLNEENDGINIKKYSKKIIDLLISKSIKENNYYKVKGSLINDNNNNKNNNICFSFKNFLLIKHFYLIGLCESYGNFGEQISKAFSVLYPSFLNYLSLEYILSKENKDFNDFVRKLLKYEDLTKNIKNIYLLSYLNDKLKLNFKFFPFLSDDISSISNILYESLFYTIKELIQKYKYEFDKTGITLCSTFIIGKILYMMNIGSSKALIIYQTKSLNNKFDCRYLKEDYKNSNFKKMMLIKRDKNTNNEEINKNLDYHELKLTDKHTILIGDFNNDKKGIIFKQKLIKYDLNIDDKIIIIGSKGFWKFINDEEEIIEFIHEYYHSKKMNSEELAIILTDIAKNRWIEENKNNPILYESKANNKLKYSEYNNVCYYDDISCIVTYLDIN